MYGIQYVCTILYYNCITYNHEQGIYNNANGQAQDCEISSVARTSPDTEDGLLVVASSVRESQLVLPPAGAKNNPSSNKPANQGKVNNAAHAQVLKLCRYPCLTPAVPIVYNYGHTGEMLDVQFTYDDGNLITSGGTDSCVFQYVCKRPRVKVEGNNI